MKIIAVILSSLLLVAAAFAQPKATTDGVRFELPDQGYSSVSVVGDFNGWSKDENPMMKDDENRWVTLRKMQPGIFQYLFYVNREKYVTDPGNPVLVNNYNNSGENSVFVFTERNTVQLTATPPIPQSNPTDTYPVDPNRKPVYLNIIWHQHQPLYLNPSTDQLEGPWVRTHATKDYYDMTAMLKNYPDIHCNVNLTSSLLFQLQEYYVNRLKPFVDVRRNRINVAGFLRKWKGKTDPWIDLLLTPTSRFGKKEVDVLIHNTWNAFGISEVQIDRFPEYSILKTKLANTMRPGSNPFNEQEMREIKFFFYLAHFDPDFLNGAVKLADKSVCDLSGYVEFRQDEKKYYLTKTITESDCRRILVEAYKVMANVIPIHKQLVYNPLHHTGQIDVITTPYYHPILPLIYDTELARLCQPDDELPERFSYPSDAHAQVVKAVKFYKQTFGIAPTGMWPAEGSVAQEVLPILRNNGIVWAATDVKVLQRSDPPAQPNTTPYRFDAGVDASGKKQSMAIVFRDTDLSDRIGFKYQNYEGEEAAEDFVRSVLSFAPKNDEADVLITVILDGENAWEWYRKDIDGKEFLNAFYRKLSKLYESKQIITVTMSEYLNGNAQRGMAAHTVDELPAMTRLWPGSWINGNYDTWIGEKEENKGWEYLLRARRDLENSGLKQPDPSSTPPKKNTKAWYAYMAYEAMYAAEGSDWFWWYGDDQSAPAGDKPFDDAFRIHLNNVYKFAQQAGAKITSPGFDPIIVEERRGGQGVMAQSTIERKRVLFTVNVAGVNVPEAIYIVGNLKELGEWTPNSVRMYDDGTNGDATADDGIWSLEVEVPVGVQVQYKFTNSGKRGEWIPGEEFPSTYRTLRVNERTEESMIIQDTFGKQ